MKIKSCWAADTKRRAYSKEHRETGAECWCAPCLMLQSRVNWGGLEKCTVFPYNLFVHCLSLARKKIVVVPGRLLSFNVPWHRYSESLWNFTPEIDIIRPNDIPSVGVGVQNLPNVFNRIEI